MLATVPACACKKQAHVQFRFEEHWQHEPHRTYTVRSLLNPQLTVETWQGKTSTTAMESYTLPSHVRMEHQ